MPALLKEKNEVSKKWVREWQGKKKKKEKSGEYKSKDKSEKDTEIFRG